MPTPSAAPASLPSKCEEPLVRESDCSVVPYGTSYLRYVLSRARSHTDATVLLDFGGPGVSALTTGMIEPLRHDHATVLDRYNLLAIEEPWATRRSTETCRQSLSAFYMAARNGQAPGQVSHAMDAACQLDSTRRSWGFEPTWLADALERIERSEHVGVSAFLGFSFASVRRTYLLRPLDWTVLVRPFPIGATADALIDARMVGVDASIRAATQMPPSSPSRSAAQRRSLPVTEFDRVSALLTLPQMYESELTAVGNGIVTGRDLVGIGSRSDALWQRYGESDVSPAYLAYLDELCRIVRGWPQLSGSIRSARDVLIAAHSPCEGIPADSTVRGWSQVGSDRVCLVLSESDPVVPASLLNIDAFYDLHRVFSSVSNHDSRDGLGECLEQVITK
jgi:hypothetical protein